jgi:alkaline phosphatase D
MLLLCRLTMGIALGVAFVPADSVQAAPFRFGVAAGEIRAHSAILWARAGSAGPVTLEVARTRSFARVRRFRLAARPGDDLTVQTLVRGFRPGTRYHYRFRQGRFRSAVGTFRTAPAPTANATVEFAISGDADATPGANGRPAFNRFQVYAQMAAEGNQFNLNVGDTIYSDSGVGGAQPALTTRAKWAKYRQNLSLPALPRLRSSAGIYSHWDDHEFVNDFSRAEHGNAIYRAGVSAFRDYAPVSYSAGNGLYRRVRWGRHLELFFLDERSFRSAKASAGGGCNNPTAPDLAPTAPQPVRLAFAALVPPLARPVPAACLERIRDPSRTMLGRLQYERFVRELTASRATFKIVVNEVPIQQFYALPYDRWEGYEAERLRLVEHLGHLRNVLFLTTDTHANLVGDVRLRTLEPGGPVATGVTEVVTGPVATNTFSREVDSVLGAAGTASAIAAFFLKPAPPRGIGMRCVSLDVYSYAQVRVTAASVTVRLKDLNGRPVTDISGSPCAPVVIPRR